MARLSAYTLNAPEAIQLRRLINKPDLGSLPKFRAAIAKTRGGTSNTNILCIGDSTTRGVGAGAGATAFLNGWPVRIGASLTQAGLTSVQQSFFGSGNVTLESNDSRLVKTGGAYTAVNLTLGGGILQETAAATFAWTPTQTVTDFDVYYIKVGGGGSSTIAIDAGGTTALSHNGTSGVYKQNINTTLGTHTLNWVWVSGTCYLLGIDAYNSAVKTVQVWNAGQSGGKMVNLVDTTAGYSALNALHSLAPNLTIINVGINDWNALTDLNTWTSQYQTLINTALTVGDVMLVTPVPSAISATPLSTQYLYVQKINDLARLNNLPLVDLWTRFTSYEIQNPLGMYFDTLHPNGPGYYDVGTAIGKKLIENI